MGLFLGATGSLSRPNQTKTTSPTACACRVFTVFVLDRAIGLYHGGARSLYRPNGTTETFPRPCARRALFRLVFFRRTTGQREGGQQLHPLHEVKLTSPKARAYRVERTNGYNKVGIDGRSRLEIS